MRARGLDWEVPSADWDSHYARLQRSRFQDICPATDNLGKHMQYFNEFFWLNLHFLFNKL